MADDPTTTGAQQQELPPGMIPVLRREVKLELDARFEVAIYGGRIWMIFFYGIPETAAELSVPLSRFESEDQATEWALETAGMFERGWGGVMGFETARHLHNIGQYNLHLMGRPGSLTLESIIAHQVKQLEKSMREWFELPAGRGKFSKWKGHELAAALITLLSRHPDYTWKELSAALKELDPARAPKTDDALRQLARRHGLGLRALKRDAAKRRGEPGREGPKKKRTVKT